MNKIKNNKLINKKNSKNLLTLFILSPFQTQQQDSPIQSLI